MADTAAAKLAAGRKMLKEFQNKKKTDYVTSDTSPQTKNISKNSDSNFHTAENNGLENKIDKHLNISNIQISEDRNKMFSSNDSHENTNPQDIFHQPAASSFFDKFPVDNTSKPSNAIPAASMGENGLPLAGILFSNNLQNFETQSHDQFSNSESIPNNIYPHTQIVQEPPNTSVDPESNTSDEDVIGPDVKTQVEISKLQQQLQFHIKTVEFLVSEKSELLEKMNEYEKEVTNLKNQSEDLTGRLNISRQRASQLEVECSGLKQRGREAEAQLAQLAQEKHQLATAHLSCQSLKNSMQEEHEELRTLMNDKILENKDLSKNIEKLTFELNSSNLRFQQMLQRQENNERPDTPLAEKCTMLQQLVEKLQRQLSELEGEKNQSSFQFQDYVQQLNQQLETINEKHGQVIQDNERLKDREIQLVNQIIALEKQMQILHRQNYIEEEILAKKSVQTESLENLQLENVQLKTDFKKMEATLQEKLNELSGLQNQLEEASQTLQQLQVERPDSAKLNAAMESDRLAAQKATTQNTKMKLDLQHLEKAFEQMTHSKLELAELLQAEKNLSKTLTLKLVETEDFLKETRLQLHAKDEEMIRLQAASSDLQKEIFKQAQVTDRLNHYEAQGHSSELLQSELQVAKSAVQSLSEENEKLKKSLQNEDIAETHSNCNHEAKVVDHKEANHKNDEFSVTLPTADAMNKLEERFTRLMKEVAELSDEKQKLEHIVLQLQGETETICEYIALYQKQRGILKQREIERNAQLNILSKERENIKSQLESLKSLIREFVPTNKIMSEDNNGSANEKSQTAEKIMTLLTQIKESHLIEPDENCGGLENFHPCPCCSGKLIIV